MAKAAGSAGALGAAAFIALHAASASFQGGTPVAQGALTAGNLYLSVPTYPGVPVGGVDSFVGNRMQLTVSDLISLDVGRERVIDVKVAGNLDLASMKVNITTSDPTNALVTDAGPLGMTIDRCSTGWTEAGSTPDYTYTCSGSTTYIIGDDSAYPTPFTLVQPTTALGAAKDHTLTSGVVLTANAINHLRVRFKLPSTTTNATMGKSMTLTLTFSGTQRAGTSK